MVNPLCTDLALTICEDADDAAKKGFVYRAPEYQPIELKRAVVVRKGTELGNATVDFIVEDDKGQKYVFMITGKILKSIPC